MLKKEKNILQIINRHNEFDKFFENYVKSRTKIEKL